MRVLVSGATGYVGSRLIPRLVDSGHEVSCMVRDASQVDPSVAESTRIVVADVLQPESLAAAMQGIEVAYYLIIPCQPPAEISRSATRSPPTTLPWRPARQE